MRLRATRSPSTATAAATLALLVLVCAACKAPVEDRAATNTLQAQLSSAPDSLTIVGTGDSVSHQVGRLLSDSLVHYDEHLDLIPGLAESWELSDDRRTVTFRLRRGVRWHDGAPFTARDVAFTVARIKQPETLARSYAPPLDRVDRVVVEDDHTLRAHYSEPTPDYLAAWWFPIIPEHAAGGDEPFLTGPFSRQPIGCGPFRFVSYEADQRIELEANPDYWDGAPALDRLVLRVLPDRRTAFQALLQGELDLITATPDLYSEAAGAPGIARFSYYRLSVWFLGWREDGSNPFFDDARIRRAMVLSLDREGFAEKLMAGLARPAATSYHPDSHWTDRALRPLPHDPEAARRLLAEAGFVDRDGDGWLERGDTPFAFTLTVRIGGSRDVVDRLAAWIQESLREIGVRMEIETLEANAFAERRNQGDFQAIMTGLSFDAIPDQYELYHSTMTFDGGGFNYGAFADPEVDRLLELGRSTFDDEARHEIYRSLQARLLEQQPISALFHFPSPVLHDARLRGIRGSPLDHWRVKPGPAAWHWAGTDGE